MMVVGTRSLKVSNVNFLFKEQVNTIQELDSSIKQNYQNTYTTLNTTIAVQATKPVCTFYVQEKAIQYHT